MQRSALAEYFVQQKPTCIPSSSFSGDGGGVILISTSEPSEDPFRFLFLLLRNVAGGLKQFIICNIIFRLSISHV
jgi:hypothetical protein